MALTILTTTGAGNAALGDGEIYVVPEDVVLGDDTSAAEFDTASFDDVTLIVQGTIASDRTSTSEPIEVRNNSDGTAFFIEETGIVTGGINETFRILGTGTYVSNKGTISGPGTAISATGGNTIIDNYGTISVGGGSGAVFTVSLAGFNSHVNNYGTISGAGGAVAFSNDESSLTNHGDIVSSGAVGIIASGANFRLNNTGTITADREAVWFQDDGYHLVNSGEISGEYGVFTVAANLNGEIVNSGSIVAEVDGILILGGGEVVISNSGVISAGMNAIELDLIDVALTLNNTGVIESRSQGTAIQGEENSDVILNSGQILGDVDTGAGDDFFLTTGDGLVAGQIDGGDGNDVITGGSGGDVIDGGAGDDVISGGSGVDELEGGAGIDIVLGGEGADAISGGAGIDFLLGEEGADVFHFRATTDSPTGGDVTSILDFEQGADLIDLYTIETSIAFLGNDAFTGSGDAELRTTNVGGVLSIVDFDVDGNGTSDMQIIVYGALDMTRADFGL